MRTIRSSRRTALKMLLAGSVATLASGCGVLESLPRGGQVGGTDGKELSKEVRTALRNHPDTATLVLTISSEDDQVLIKGIVDSQSDFDNIEIISNRVAGVRHVQMDVFLR